MTRITRLFNNKCVTTDPDAFTLDGDDNFDAIRTKAADTRRFCDGDNDGVRCSMRAACLARSVEDGETGFFAGIPLRNGAVHSAALPSDRARYARLMAYAANGSESPAVAARDEEYARQLKLLADSNPDALERAFGASGRHYVGATAS